MTPVLHRCGTVRNWLAMFNMVSHHTVLSVWQVHVRVLQNSMEQFILSVMTQLAICTWLTASQMICIPIVVVLFFVGRILYWIGYLNPTKNRVNRSFGFPLTFVPTTVMIVFCIYKLVTTRL